jgi:hypothetical protein
MKENGSEKGDDALILALASGLSVREAAAQAKVGETTVYRRLKDSAFRQRITDARNRLFECAVGKLADAATEAVTTLRVLLNEKSPMVRLGAARCILEAGPRLREHLELEGRMRSIEERISADGFNNVHITNGHNGHNGRRQLPWGD